jgi:hypothetical protein
VTHGELVQHAMVWLKDGRNCRVALSRIAPGAECPDAIGFFLQPIAGRDVGYEWASVLIECKTSRADFIADSSKPFRVQPETGMGRYRYFLAPKGLLKPDELPQGWGLLEPTPKAARIVTLATERTVWNRDAEFSMLLSVLNAYQAQGLDYKRLPTPTFTRHTSAIQLQPPQKEQG